MQSVNKFPNGMFPYGAPIHITPEDHAARVAEAPEPRVPYGIAVWATTSNTKRSLHEANRLGVDETVLYHDEDTVTPSEHWATVLELIPVQPWVDAGRVVVYLATTQPLEKPANTRLWRLARKWLHECVERGSKSGWGENSDFPDELQDESFWEALRIIGDTDAGYGTFPDTLKEKMDAVGVTWILVNPRDRWIPVCWKTWADRAGMDYAAALDIMTMPSTQVTHTDKASTMPATPTRAAARATSAVTPSKIALIKFTPRKRKRVMVDESQTADIGSLTPSTPRTTFIIKRRGDINQTDRRESGMSVQTVDTEMAEAITQTSASAAYEAIGHTQEPPQPGEQASENERRMETTSFVKFDEAAHIALQKLRTSNIPARLGEPKWPGIAITAQEVSIITQKAIEVGKTNFKTDIRSLMRHALIGGPIQARIEELINDAFCEAGINDRATLSQTIRAIICDIYDPMEERLSNVTTECDELSDSIKGMQQENEITTSNIGLLFGIIKETDAVTVKIDVFTDMKHQVENLSRKIEDLTENANEDERAINELEGRLRKQEEKNEALSAKLDDLTAKVQENAALTAKLDDLAAKVQENAAISAKLDDLAAKVQENADVSAKLDDLLHDNEDIIGRIDDQDEQIQQIEDLAYKFGEIPSKAREREIATIMDKIDDIAEQVEEYDDLSVKINDISVRVQEYDTVATKVNGIASRVDRHDTIIKDFTTAQQTDLTLTSPHDANDVDEFGRPKNFWA